MGIRFFSNDITNNGFGSHTIYLISFKWQNNLLGIIVFANDNRCNRCEVYAPSHFNDAKGVVVLEVFT